MTDDTLQIPVGISACLLGQNVRYNGGHKHSPLCTTQLGRYFEFIPSCPEAGAGLGIPRPAIRLVDDPAAPRAVHVADAGIEVTDQLKAYAAQRLPELGDLCGYVFIKNSPSCGLFRVKVYQQNGYPHPDSGVGIFAEAFTRQYPLVPVEEEGRLHDPVLRENFVVRVFALHNWKKLCSEGLSAARLTDFHARYKYTLMAHSPAEYTSLGRMLADAGKHDPHVLGQRYFSALMQALQKRATRKTNTNVLMHLQGYLKKVLQPREKQSLGQVIENYRKGIVPLVVPVTLLKHHFHQYPDDYISRQFYLQPYPDDLSLRNTL
jgi:uncharacterized protein YbgA (DUF1722 family)/uncharacterized protein YbbK (DUF523 family)